MTRTGLICLLTGCICGGRLSYDALGQDQTQDNSSHLEQVHPQSSEIRGKNPAPVAGVPVLMDLSHADGVRMTEVLVAASVKQHQISLVVTCALNIPDGIKGKSIPIGIPIRYDIPDEQANIILQQPVRHVPFSQALLDASTSVDDLVCPSILIEGKHLQADSPMMQPVSDITHWFVAQVPNKEGRHILTFRFALPYSGSFEISPESKVSMNAPEWELMISPLLCWTGGVSEARVDVYGTEILPQLIRWDEAVPAEKRIVSPAGVVSWALLNEKGRPYASSLRIHTGKKWSLNSQGQITIGKDTGILSDAYSVSSDVLPHQDPYGRSCSAENLKTGRAYWAIGKDEIEQGKGLELRLDHAAPLLGIMIEPGISPVSHPENDSEARRHPNLAYSFYGRPREFHVTLNGEYSFDATIKDDWLPQIIVPLYYKKEVRDIRIQVRSAYPGSGSEDTFIGIVKPIIK